MFRVYLASGRATCQECKKVIAKGEIQVNYTGWHNATGNAHYNCIVAMAEKVESEAPKIPQQLEVPVCANH